MKRVRVYKEIISDENLRLAIREVNAGHRRNGNHSLNKKVIEIENNMDEYVEKLRAFIQGLVDGDEHMHPPLKRHGVLIGAFFSAWFLHLTLQPLDLMIHQKQYGVSHYLRQMDNFTIFGSNKRKLRRLLEDIKKWLAEIGMKIKGNWQIFRVGFTPKVERAHQALPKKKQRHRRPRLPSALGYRFGHGYTILRKHNLFRLKQSLHLYYYRRDRNRVISFKRASGLISRLGQLRKCNHQQVLDRHYQPKTMFALKKVVRKECRRLQALYPPYQAA